MTAPADRLALFDFDGTLADSAPWFFAVMNDVARRYGFREITPDEREALRGLDNRAIIRQLGVPLWKIPAIAGHMRERVRDDAHLIRPFPWVADVLAALSGHGVAIAVVTSNSEDNVRRILGPAADAVCVMACGASLFGKAAKMQAVLKRTGIAKARAIAFGDETRDIDAARTSGIMSAAVTWGYATADALRKAAPDHLISDPMEIVRLAAGPEALPPGGRRSRP